MERKLAIYKKHDTLCFFLFFIQIQKMRNKDKSPKHFNNKKKTFYITIYTKIK